MLEGGRASGRSAIALLSGGIDSAVCAHMLLNQGYATRGLFVDYGQDVASSELAAATAIAQGLAMPLDVRTIAGGGARGDGEHVGRNALLVAAAAFEAGRCDGVIAIGIHAGTPYYDCSPAFLEAMGRIVAEQTDGRTRLVAPLLAWSKAEVLEAFRATALPLAATHSCEASVEPCGRCASCLDRLALGC